MISIVGHVEIWQTVFLHYMLREPKKHVKSDLNPKVDALVERVISGEEKVTVYDTPEDYLKHIKQVLEEK
jgi:hypothetical protein